MESKYQVAFTEFLNTCSDHERKYVKSLYCGAIKIGDKFLLLDKKSIKTEFCFSDEGSEFKTFCKVSATDQTKIDYFKSENLRKYNIEFLHDDSFIHKLHVSLYTPNILEYYSVKRLQSDNTKGVYREMTDAEIAEYENGLQFARAEHEKRLDAYLKRNGTSQLRFFTFYADI